MDISKDYINMCKKAKEIQDKWKPKEGDFVTYHYKPQEMSNIFNLVGQSELYISVMPCVCDIRSQALNESYHMCNCITATEFKNKDDWFWLPRQDQLQKIIRKENDTTLHLIQRFYWWLDTCKETSSPDILKKSMEQLWLAYVMKEKYNKYWTNKAWKL